LDKFFDALGDILKSLLAGESSSSSSSHAGAYSDPDMEAAWKELDEYLEEDGFETQGRGSSKDRRRDPFADRQREPLRQDYANLEVRFAAPFAEVKKSYKLLMQRYHPDRNADDPEKLRVANEIAKKINASYRRIRDFEEAHTRGPT
jgi:DnaJ-domain-containing protein 1